MSTYVFEKPLIRGTMLKRKSQFTALVDIDGEELTAHIPTTNRIGDVENKNLPCLLSYDGDRKEAKLCSKERLFYRDFLSSEKLYRIDVC